MKGFYIEITNNLLEKKHRKAMGSAVWEFMWCLDKITKIDDDGIGWVLGGKPVNLGDIAKEIGIHRVNVSKHLAKLTKHGYLHLTHAPYGIVIRVSKAKKRFGKDVKPIRDSEIANPLNEVTKPNKTDTEDNTVKTYVANATPEKEKLELLRDVVEHYKQVKGFDQVAGWDRANFPMNSKYARQLIGLIRDNFRKVTGWNEDDIIVDVNDCINTFQKWGEITGLSWTLSTVVRRFGEYMRGTIDQEIKSRESRKQRVYA